MAPGFARRGQRRTWVWCQGNPGHRNLAGRPGPQHRRNPGGPAPRQARLISCPRRGRAGWHRLLPRAQTVPDSGSDRPGSQHTPAA